MHFKKGKVVFRKNDIGELDILLAQVIYSGVTQFHKTKMRGKIPSIIFEEMGQDPFKEIAEEVLEQAIKKWDSILNKIIFAFSPYQYYSDIEPSLVDVVFEPIDETTDSIKFNPKKGYIKQDVESYDQRSKKWMDDYHQKREEGRLLFAKYFDSLYD